MHIGPKYMVALAGLALAGVLAAGAAAQPGGPLPAAVQVSKQPPPDPSQVCPAQFAFWTDNGASVTVNVNAPSGTNVAVSVETGTALMQEAAPPSGAALTFSFAVPGAQINVIRIRHNEGACEVQKRSPA